MACHIEIKANFIFQISWFHVLGRVFLEKKESKLGHLMVLLNCSTWSPER